MGAPCNIGVAIRNLGNVAFVGELGIDGQIAPAMRLRQVLATGPGWGCEITGQGAYQCRHNPLTLAPGAMQSFRISAVLPARLSVDAITHSVKLVWVEGKPDSDSRDDSASVTIPLTRAEQPAITPLPQPVPAVPLQPRIQCSNGTVRDGQCVCPQGWRRRTIGVNRYRCIKPASTAPAPQITCSGGNVVNGACVCPRGWNQRRIGLNRLRCVRSVERIQCSNGKVRNGRCICPKGYSRRTIGHNRYRCVKPVVQIQCRNGTVRNGRCICPKGYNRRTIGHNRYRCVKPVVQIQCRNGTVRNGRCICRQGWRRARRGSNRYVCIRPQARVRCSGGSVRNGRCICPAGKIARRVGRNAYRCVWRAPD